MLGSTASSTLEFTKPTSSTRMMAALCPLLACKDYKGKKVEEIRRSGSPVQSHAYKQHVEIDGRRDRREGRGDERKKRLYEKEQEIEGDRPAHAWTLARGISRRSPVGELLHVKGCPFEDDRVRGRYVCRAHYSEHSCSGPSCALIHAKASRVPYGTSSESSCPVVELLTFRKEELEFKDPCVAGTRGPEASYGALGRESGPGRGCRPRTEEELDAVALVLKSCLPAMIAHFSTLLTDEFLRQYEVADCGQAPVAGPQSWTEFCTADRVRFGGRAELGLAGEWQASVVREATLRSAVAVSTLAMGELFSSRTLVLMCFDKTRTRHNQWSMLATHIHLHVNQPEFAKGLAGSDLESSLPLMVAVTLDKYTSCAASDKKRAGWGRSVVTIDSQVTRPQRARDLRGDLSPGTSVQPLLS
ncbi:hypothetical protein Q5P01_008469 [Channa striata]|uniref:Uncharacterized protein n=1 Tax=Channa striata TaxID=64152 RepID=A0AA88N0R4_CHASR|nr:hypothetical protein Q5P01_008469 [Channa striata]